MTNATHGRKEVEAGSSSPGFSRARANTSDANLTPVRLSDTRVCVIGEDAITYNSRTTGVVPGVLLGSLPPRRATPATHSDAEDDASPSPRAPGALGGVAAGAGGAGAGTSRGCTYLLRFTLTEGAQWRGERCLFSRGDNGAQVSRAVGHAHTRLHGCIARGALAFACN